jgi:hypothetical protein
LFSEMRIDWWAVIVIVLNAKMLKIA